MVGDILLLPVRLLELKALDSITMAVAAMPAIAIHFAFWNYFWYQRESNKETFHCSYLLIVVSRSDTIAISANEHLARVGEYTSISTLVVNQYVHDEM